MRKWLVLLMVCVVGLAGCTNEEYEKAVADAQAALEDMDYENAAAAFELALEEKPDDEEAEMLLENTKMMLDASERMESGDVETALESIGFVIETENGSELLVEQAKDIQGEIESLQAQYKTYETTFAEAKKAMEADKYTEVVDMSETMLQNDLTHAVFAGIQTDFEQLLKTAHEEKAVAERVAKEEAQKKKEAEEKRKQEEAEEKARAEAEEKKRREEEKAKTEAAAKEKKQAQQGIGIDAFAGYWLNQAEDLAIHITPEYISTAMPYSDVITNDAISTVTSVGQHDVQVTFKDGGTITIKSSGNKSTMTIRGLNYRRVSKEEANAIFDGYYELP